LIVSVPGATKNEISVYDEPESIVISVNRTKDISILDNGDPVAWERIDSSKTVFSNKYSEKIIKGRGFEYDLDFVKYDNGVLRIFFKKKISGESRKIEIS
jgi:HSP20 family molecular chaperone IbpA